MSRESEIRVRAILGLKEGDLLKVSRRFTDRDVELFTDFSRDHNPVHSDPVFAGIKKFKRTICHGLLVGSLVTEIGGQIGWLATKIEFSFKRPVYPGDEVTCTMKICSLNERGYAHAECEIVNQSGEVVTTAKLSGFLPGTEERARMKG